MLAAKRLIPLKEAAFGASALLEERASRRGSRRGVCILLALGLSAATANAWIIEQTDPFPGSGKAEAVVVPFHRSGNTDRFEIDKYYLPDFVPNEDHLILKFTMEQSDKDAGITRVRIVDEIILNLTGYAWDDYHLSLWSYNEPGDDDSVQFVDPNSARAWKQTGGATRLGWKPFSTTATQINWVTDDANQGVPSGSFSSAPSNQLVLKGIDILVSNLEAGDAFYLKQWPTVPEPGTFALLILGLVVWPLRRRR